MKNDIANLDQNGSAAAAISAAALLNPARHFSHLSKVVSAPDLSVGEKRAILASWASDLYTLELKPTMRIVPAGSRKTTDMT
ncbi:hypothetical protein [Rhizobium sp. PL01]|uniref:hypothetical protein n=1 Tax=Rhizobium sp. PL01 TaxID=3085631 RepID=UPI002982382D|nr:hypothetical protein [Rhizobium sp. PL01]MDW5315847.1 hypothetical protein [Rhizobium sp. PL01]